MADQLEKRGSLAIVTYAEGRYTLGIDATLRKDMTDRVAQNNVDVARVVHVEAKTAVMNRAIWMFSIAAVLFAAVVAAVLAVDITWPKAIVITAGFVMLSGLLLALRPVVTKMLEQAIKGAG